VTLPAACGAGGGGSPVGRRRTRYQLVHVLPDGSRTRVGPLITAWLAAVARAEELVAALQAELARGNLDAGGVIWIIDLTTSAIAQQLVIGSEESVD
jgi:hypothetical protein